jgi:hypothetical protein
MLTIFPYFSNGTVCFPRGLELAAVYVLMLPGAFGFNEVYGKVQGDCLLYLKVEPSCQEQ